MIGSFPIFMIDNISQKNPPHSQGGVLHLSLICLIPLKIYGRIIRLRVFSGEELLLAYDLFRNGFCEHFYEAKKEINYL